MYITGLERAVCAGTPAAPLCGSKLRPCSERLKFRNRFTLSDRGGEHRCDVAQQSLDAQRTQKELEQFLAFGGPYFPFLQASQRGRPPTTQAKAALC